MDQGQGIGDECRRVLKNIFGFSEYRPGQEIAIDAIMAGQNVLTVMPTGSGKSICFQVPALVRGGLTVVVSPLVALMGDQVAALKLAGVAADAINSSRDRRENVDAWRRAASGATRLLYMSPERLMTDAMLKALEGLDVTLIAIDEAHCVSQWGPAFRPEYADLRRLRDIFPDVPIVALTATADEVTREDISEQLFAGNAKTFVLGFDRPNIKLTVEMKQSWKSQMLSFIEQHGGESGIIYCLSRKKSEEAAAYLSDRGVLALPYHAGMERTARDINQDRFMAEAGVVIVATIAFGMGIDKPDVRFVFHADLPGSIEAYYQEIGRAGRDDQPADAHMLYGLDDIRMRRLFIEQEDADDSRKRRGHHRLDALLGFCEAPVCRRRVLLNYFGEETAECGNCDVCVNPVEMVLGTIEGKKALSAVFRTGQRFGTAHIIDVLRGAETAKIVSVAHDKLPTFGVGADYSKNEWRSLIRQLVASGFLRLDVSGFGGLSITEKGQRLLQDKEEFRFRKEAMRPDKPARRRVSKGPAMAGLTEHDAEMFIVLKALRLSIARERGVPAFVVFSDKTLAEMACQRPGNKKEFGAINGVGKVKQNEFSASFLEAIAEFSSGSPAGENG